MSFLDLVHRHGRAAEWVCSLGFWLFGATLLLPGSTMHTSIAYSGFLALGLSDVTLGLVCAFIGFWRLVALVRNGMWKPSPYIRVGGAIIGSATFACIAGAFQWPYIAGQSQAASTASIYLVLALSDLLSAARAGADVRSGA